MIIYLVYISVYIPFELACAFILQCLYHLQLYFYKREMASARQFYLSNRPYSYNGVHASGFKLREEKGLSIEKECHRWCFRLLKGRI